MADLDFFGEVPAPVKRQSNAGRPLVPLRTMIALLHLKHAFNLGDEAVVGGWSENPYWQHISGMAYFEPRLHCDATTLVRFRRLPGGEQATILMQDIGCKPATAYVDLGYRGMDADIFENRRRDTGCSVLLGEFNTLGVMNKNGHAEHGGFSQGSGRTHNDRK